MEPLMEQIATNAADYAVGKYGQHLPKGRQLRLWKLHYDGVLAALFTYEEMAHAHRVRSRTLASEN